MSDVRSTGQDRGKNPIDLTPKDVQSFVKVLRYCSQRGLSVRVTPPQAAVNWRTYWTVYLSSGIGRMDMTLEDASVNTLALVEDADGH